MTSQCLPDERTVVIDPGHGGEDRGGAGVTGYVEAEFTLDLAHRLSRLLELSAVKAVLTRHGDDTVPAIARRRAVRQRSPALCVSLHTAGYPWTTEIGVAAWYSVERFFASRRLAALLAESVRSATGRPSRGTVFCLPWGSGQEGYEILAGTGVPTVVVELGCHTSGEDESLLGSDRFRERCAAGLCNGILRYLGRFDAPSAPSEPHGDPAPERGLVHAVTVTALEEAVATAAEASVPPPVAAVAEAGSAPPAEAVAESAEAAVEEAEAGAVPLSPVLAPVEIHETALAPVSVEGVKTPAAALVPPQAQWTDVDLSPMPVTPRQLASWTPALAQPFFRRLPAGARSAGIGWHGGSHWRRGAMIGHFAPPHYVLECLRASAGCRGQGDAPLLGPRGHGPT